MDDSLPACVRPNAHNFPYSSHRPSPRRSRDDGKRRLHGRTGNRAPPTQHTDAVADAHGHPHGHSYAHGNAHGYPNRDSYPHANPYGDPDPDSYRDPDPDSAAGGDAYPYAPAVRSRP